MGLAIDTVLAQVTNSVALTNATVAAGDTLTVRNFDPPASGYLENVIIKGGQVTTARILSPVFHDPVRGITILSAQAPTTFSLPREVGQPLTPGDVLTLQGNSGGANSSVFALQNYYTDMLGAAARLASWGDISGDIVNLKPLEIDLAASATIGAWNDVALTATENLLRANTDYAVLGYNVDVACGVVALRGPDTSNLRVSGPGSVIQIATEDYFAAEGFRTGRPHIPIINSANAGATFVSVADNAASTAVKCQLILAQLGHPFQG